MARPLLEIPSLCSDSPITHALLLPPSSTGTGVRDGGRDGVFSLAAPTYSCPFWVCIFKSIMCCPCGGFKREKQDQGPPSSADEWRLVAHLLSAAGTLLSLQPLLSVSSAIPLAACNGEDEQTPSFFLFLPIFCWPSRLSAGCCCSSCSRALPGCVSWVSGGFIY